MEVARDAWSLLEGQAPLAGVPPREGAGPPWWAEPPPRWCACRDLGRLAKRPSAIILSSETRDGDVSGHVSMGGGVGSHKSTAGEAAHPDTPTRQENFTRDQDTRDDIVQEDMRYGYCVASGPVNTHNRLNDLLLTLPVK